MGSSSILSFATAPVSAFVVLVLLHLSFAAIFESGNNSLNKLPAWSAIAIERLCSSMNPEKSSSAPVTFTSSLFVAVDDPQYVSEQPDLRDVTFDLCFGVSRCLLMSFTPPYPITKSFAQVV